MRRHFHFLYSAALLAMPLSLAASATPNVATTTHHSSHHSHAHVQESAATQKHITHMQHSHRVAASTTTSTAHHSSGSAHVRGASLTVRHHGTGERFYASSFTDADLTQGDITAGEDPVVRQAAIAALGNMY